MQSPIAPPYEEALSLLEDRSTDFRKADVSVIIDNDRPISLAEFKEKARRKPKCLSERLKEEDQTDESQEDVLNTLSLDALLHLNISDESNDLEKK